MSSNSFIGVVPDLKRKAGFLKYRTCTLEMIVAHSTSELRNRFKEISPETHYKSMSHEKIMKESPYNIILPSEDMKRIRLIRWEGEKDVVHGGPDKLAIRTLERKHLFFFGSETPPAEKVYALLKQGYAHLLT
jgi:hypothetical protein